MPVRRALALALVVLGLVAAPAAAQEGEDFEEESPDVEDVVEVPLEVPDTSVATDTTTPVTRVPQACTPIEPPYIVFRGTVAAMQAPVVRFDLVEVERGAWELPQIDVLFPDDHRFVDLGATYVVAAELDERTGLLYSKVKVSSKTLPPPGTCPGEDPIITVTDDGDPVETGMFAGMRGRWGRILVAFAVPLLALLAALLAAVGIKYLVLRALRSTAPGWR